MTTATAVGPTAGSRLRRARVPLVIAAFAVLTAVVLAALTGQQTAGRLDPRATDPSGSRAVARVLGSLGVDAVLVRTVDDALARTRGGAATLLVADDALVPDDALRRLAGDRTAPDVVLVTPSRATLRAVVPGVSAAGDVAAADSGARAPACTDPDAVAAGPADVAGQGYSVGEVAPGTTVTACYPRDGFASLVVVGQPSGRRVVILGDPAALTNARAGERGNAALALRLLGRHPRLVWLLPDGTDAADAGSRSLGGLLPAAVRWGLLQLLVAVVVLALVRARRLGRVVPERLPVVVRASETAEGRGRLYQRGRARGTAADALRTAALTRLGPRTGVPPGAAPDVVVTTVAARTGRAAEDVGRLLYGPAPADDAALVRLATELDTLEREVTAP